MYGIVADIYPMYDLNASNYGITWNHTWIVLLPYII